MEQKQSVIDQTNVVKLAQERKTIATRYVSEDIERPCVDVLVLVTNAAILAGCERVLGSKHVRTKNGQMGIMGKIGTCSIIVAVLPCSTEQHQMSYCEASWQERYRIRHVAIIGSGIAMNSDVTNDTVVVATAPFWTNFFFHWGSIDKTNYFSNLDLEHTFLFKSIKESCSKSMIDYQFGVVLSDDNQNTDMKTRQNLAQVAKEKFKRDVLAWNNWSWNACLMSDSPRPTMLTIVTQDNDQVQDMTGQVLRDIIASIAVPISLQDIDNCTSKEAKSLFDLVKNWNQDPSYVVRLSQDGEHYTIVIDQSNSVENVLAATVSSTLVEAQQIAKKLSKHLVDAGFKIVTS
jgi:uncharacterized surface protein with fasciclin (FAS1) repeats